MDNLVNALMGKQTTVLPQNVQNYLNTVSTQPYAKNLTPEQVQGIAQGLNYGIQDIADMQKKLGINAPQDANQLALARQGKLNYQQRQGGILNDLGRGMQQNYNNNLLQNLGKPLQNSNLATTLGQGLGSVLRFADSPLGRGLMTAGAVKALGGTGEQALAYGLGSGVTRQDLQAQDTLYRNQLQQMGIDTSKIRGNVGKDTFKTISDNYNKQQRLIVQQQIANAKDANAQKKIILDAVNRNIYSPEEGMAQLKLLGVDANLQQSNQTKFTDAKIKNMADRIAVLKQKQANGKITDTELKELNKAKKRLEIEKLQRELNNANDPFAGLKVPTKQPQQPKKQKTITVGNKKITVQ